MLLVKHVDVSTNKDKIERVLCNRDVSDIHIGELPAFEKNLYPHPHRLCNQNHHPRFENEDMRMSLQ